MRRWWWVNHSPTARREVAGDYLWSPRTERNGARSPFYDNMRRAGPGDLMLSYAGGRLRHVGRVIDYAFAAPEPGGDRDGWWLPVRWTALSPSVSPREVIGRLGPLMPGRYAPIDPASGLGRQKAFMTEISEAAFETAAAPGRFDRSALERDDGPIAEYPAVARGLDEALERAIVEDPGLDATQKRQLVTARRGQGLFRENVRAMEPACRLTGVANPWLLIASHIKPWRACATAAERLDGANGLLLTPDVDLLFDRGFISFEDEGRVLVSPRLKTDDMARLGLGRLARRKTRPFAARQARYLEWHRRWVFLE
ncbi:MAG: HNH endonuclease [Caulobacter sp.]|nr:HNH endonuclease [Caulobacter sp.]